MLRTGIETIICLSPNFLYVLYVYVLDPFGTTQSVWSSDQTRCTFGELRKPNPNTNLTLTLKLTLALTLILIPALTRPNPIASALRDWPNIAQFVKCCAIDELISGAACLVKHTIDQMCATITRRNDRNQRSIWNFDWKRHLKLKRVLN